MSETTSPEARAEAERRARCRDLKDQIEELEAGISRAEHSRDKVVARREEQAAACEKQLAEAVEILTKRAATFREEAAGQRAAFDAQVESLRAAKGRLEAELAKLDGRTP